jgi:hypothetical protein
MRWYGPAFASGAPHVGGRITDAQGGLVPAATVLVVSNDTGVKQQTRFPARSAMYPKRPHYFLKISIDPCEFTEGQDWPATGELNINPSW